MGRNRDYKKKESIVNATIKHVNQSGFEGLSISKVATTAQVSPATIYIYFENKDDLLNSIFLMIREKMSKAGLEHITDDLSIEQAFKQIWRDYCNFALEHLDWVDFRVKYEQNYSTKIKKEEKMSIAHYIIKLFQDGMKRKIIKELPLDLLVSFAFIPIITLLKLHQNQSFELSNTMIEEASQLAWNAIRLK